MNNAGTSSSKTCSTKYQFVDDSESDQDLFDAVDELERSFNAEKNSVEKSSQDVPASKDKRKLKKLFSSAKVRI